MKLSHRSMRVLNPSVTKTLRGGDNVILRGFGAFGVAKGRARTGKNPRTRKESKIPVARVFRGHGDSAAALTQRNMETPEQKNGIVAILDALGAANYDDEEIAEFLKSRQVVMRLLNDKAESIATYLSVGQVKTYTFNDTMLIVLETDDDRPTADEIQAFVTVLRKLLVDSLKRRIMFRGSFAVGSFYEDSSTNTILGKAVTDAAAWYDKANWIGILATPRTTVFIDSLKERDDRGLGPLLIDYAVPLSGGGDTRLWTVNWPKVFWVNSITPCRPGDKPREAFLDLLSRFSIPRGTELKHFNSIAFFDHVVKKLKLKNEPRDSGKR